MSVPVPSIQLRRADSFNNSNASASKTSSTSSPKASPRNIAAPFQLRTDGESPVSIASPGKPLEKEDIPFNFVPLEDFAEMTFEKVLVIFRLINSQYLVSTVVLLQKVIGSYQMFFWWEHIQPLKMTMKLLIYSLRY